jgi:hypothetical protein
MQKMLETLSQKPDQVHASDPTYVGGRRVIVQGWLQAKVGDPI